MKTKERLKSILLVVLVCGAAFLTYATWFYDNPLGQSVPFSLFGSSASGGGQELLEDGQLENLWELQPVRAAVKSDMGRYGVEYRTDAVDALFDSTRALVAEALGTITTPIPIDEERWLGALRGNGIFYDFQGVVPMDSLKVWMGVTGVKTEASGVKGRYLILAPEPVAGRTRLYLKDPYTGQMYVYETGLTDEEVEEALKAFPSNGCMFACEMAQEGYQKISPETFVVTDTLTPQNINGYNVVPFFSQEQLNQFLKCFGFNEFTTNQYVEQDGTQVYIEDINTVKVSPDGFVVYTDTRPDDDQQKGIFVQSASDTPSAVEVLETARALVSRMAALVPGIGRLYLQDFKYFDDQGDYVALFGWSVNGIPVDRQQTGYAARVVVHGHKVTEASFYMRSYENAGSTAKVLSQKLAVAALSGTDDTGELALRYTDAGQNELSPDWYVKSEQEMP